MGTKSIRHIVEGVISAQLALDDGLTGVNFYTGDSASVVDLPRCVVVVDAARPPADLPEGLGNYSCTTRVIMSSNADDTSLATHRARCASIAGVMQGLASLKSAFTATGDATLYDVTPSSEDEGVDERSWATSMSYEVLVVVPPAA
jgi:hypothetical protein